MIFFYARQIANLANALRRGSCSSDSRSCSGESSKVYIEPADDILKCKSTIHSLKLEESKENMLLNHLDPYEASQQDTVGWSEEPNNRLSYLQVRLFLFFF